jgi:hypothetical protein
VGILHQHKHVGFPWESSVMTSSLSQTGARQHFRAKFIVSQQLFVISSIYKGQMSYSGEHSTTDALSVRFCLLYFKYINKDETIPDVL